MNWNGGVARICRPPLCPIQIRPVARPGKHPGGDRDHVKLMRGARLEHDPEKWEPVFRKDHAQTRR
jgi:hypothetical protein